MLAGFWAMQAVHTGSPARRCAIYFLGYLPGVVLFNVGFVGIGWLLVVLLIVGYDR